MTYIKTSEAKKYIVEKLVESGLANNLKDKDLSLIRIREKTGEDKLTQVYHDERELGRY